jgi:hypothetical protein
VWVQNRILVIKVTHELNDLLSTNHIIIKNYALKINSKAMNLSGILAGFLGRGIGPSQHKENANMSREGLKPAIPTFWRSKTVRAIDVIFIGIQCLL